MDSIYLLDSASMLKINIHMNDKAIEQNAIDAPVYGGMNDFIIKDHAEKGYDLSDWKYVEHVLQESNESWREYCVRWRPDLLTD